MSSRINMERLAMLKPDAVMVHATEIPKFDKAPKLLEAGFKPVINTSYMESTPRNVFMPGQIIEMLANLVTNASKANGERQGIINLNIRTISSENIPSLNLFPIDWKPRTAFSSPTGVSPFSIFNTDNVGFRA